MKKSELKSLIKEIIQEVISNENAEPVVPTSGSSEESGEQTLQRLDASTVKRFIQALKSHDWYYERSDDRRQFSRGRDEASNIHRLYDYLKKLGSTDEEKKKVAAAVEELYKKYNPMARK